MNFKAHAPARREGTTLQQQMLTEYYRRLAADYICLGYYCRYTMMTARERKPKSGACLGGQ
jgi:hypothetical protein